MVKRFFYYMTLLASVLLTACSNDEAVDTEQSLPEGMGRIRLTICSPETAGGSTTRAVNVTTPWEDPDHDWEKLQTFRILICKASNNEVVQIISGTKDQMTDATTLPSTYKSTTVTSQPLEAGTYYIYATANYADGYSEGSVVDLNSTVKFANGYSETYIPMTGKLTSTPGGNDLKEVGVANGLVTDVTDTPLTVWRVMGKMQFYFTNESTEKIRILGVEVEPLNLATDDEDDTNDGPGIYLFSKDYLASTDNLYSNDDLSDTRLGVTLPTGAREDVGTFRYQPATAPVTLDGYSGSGDKPTGTFFFYVNETDATFTTTNNQLSLRFKIARGDDDSEVEEIRYGVTTHYGDGSIGQNGFNVIRRNDWIHIPVVLTDWQFRIEPIAFVPIAGYPAKTMSSDGLTATFSTGGMIVLQPFVKKYSDNSWRDFSNAEVTFESVSWKNSDEGDNPSGLGKILLSPFTYDNVNNCIVGELNNNLSPGTYKTTVTVNVKLGPQPDPNVQTDNQPQPYSYTFTFNIVLAIPGA